MQTFLFSELSKRAQDAACTRYEGEQIVQEAANEIIDQEDGELLSIPGLFDGLGWRFTEHGERIG